MSASTSPEKPPNSAASEESVSPPRQEKGAELAVSDRQPLEIADGLRRHRDGPGWRGREHQKSEHPREAASSPGALLHGGPRHGLGRGLFGEQFGQLFGHGAAQFLGIDDGDGALVVARHVMADADGDEFDGRALLDVVDHLAQMLLEIVAGVDRER